MLIDLDYQLIRARNYRFLLLRNGSYICSGIRSLLRSIAPALINVCICNTAYVLFALKLLSLVKEET